MLPAICICHRCESYSDVIKGEKGTKGGKSKTSKYKMFFFFDRAAFEIVRHTHASI